jgi:hypothetical protein
MGLTTPVDVPALTDYIAARDVGLLVLDPLTSVMDGRIDAHSDREVRKALEPLGRVPWIFAAGSCRSVRCLIC